MFTQKKYINVKNGFLHNSLNIGNNPNVHLTDRWINKKVVYTYKRVLFGNKSDEVLIDV